jgi:hypothetical protein
MHDKRLTSRLSDYWDRIRQQDALPCYSKINPSAIADIWPKCAVCVVEVKGSDRYKIDRVGDDLKAIWGSNMLGKPLRVGQQHFQGSAIFKKMGAILESPAPFFDEGQYVNERSRVVKYRSCMLPFGDSDGKHVTHIVVGLSWREF